MKRQPVVQRWFKCPDCHKIFAAFKSKAKQTSEGHIKDMYCPWCRKDQKMIQIRYH